VSDVEQIPAAPFEVGQSVRDRFSGKTVRGTVAAITPEENGIGELYWWVVVLSNSGSVGLDAADLVPAR
jgi:hypothetical protein